MKQQENRAEPQEKQIRFYKQSLQLKILYSRWWKNQDYFS